MSSAGRGRGFRSDSEVSLRKPGQNQKETPPVEYFNEVKNLIDEFTADNEERFFSRMKVILAEVDDLPLAHLHKALSSLALNDEHFAIKYAKTIMSPTLRKPIPTSTSNDLRKRILADLQSAFEGCHAFITSPQMVDHTKTEVRMAAFLVAKYFRVSIIPRLLRAISKPLMDYLEYFARSSEVDTLIMIPVTYILLRSSLHQHAEGLMKMVREKNVDPNSTLDIRILSLFILDLHAYGENNEFPPHLREYYHKFESSYWQQKLRFYLDEDIDAFVKSSSTNTKDCTLTINNLKISEAKQDDVVQRKEGQVPRAILGSRSK